MGDNDLTFIEACFSKYGMQNNGVIHVGAHYAQEAEFYHSIQSPYVLWIEGVSTVAEVARTRIKKLGFSNQDVVTAMISNLDSKDVDFYYASNNGASSSLLRPRNHIAIHPEVKFTIGTTSTYTLNEIVKKFLLEKPKFLPPTILVLDLQGAEIAALEGYSRYLEEINFIVIEISVSKIYKKAPGLNDVNKFLEKKNFKLISSKINSNFDYGDALFIRTQINNSNFMSRLRSKSKGQLIRLFLIKLGLERIAKIATRR
jgi:FkbM family methyltransferase